MSETSNAESIAIVDAHHHLWDFRPILKMLPQEDDPLVGIINRQPTYLFDELLSDTRSGHNIVATVAVECGAFHRADGPDAMKPVGEVEHASGVAARSASGLYGAIRACCGIVGFADLTLADGAAPVLEAHIVAGNGRFKGVRMMGSYDDDPQVMGPVVRVPEGLYLDTGFRAGFAHLKKMGLSFEAWVLEPQLHELIDLARTFPDTPIAVNHVGTPLGIGRYFGKLNDRYAPWRKSMEELATCSNVSVKLSGLGMPYPSLSGLGPQTRTSPETLAETWRPYIEPCIEAFGPSRAMFASNYPVDAWGADYATIWSAFKLIAQHASPDEMAMLFRTTAGRFYNLDQFLV